MPDAILMGSGPSAAGASRQAILEEILDRLFAKNDFIRSTTTGAGSATTLVDASLVSSFRTTQNFVGAWVRLSSGSADGQFSQVVSYDRTTGTLTLSPALTTAPGASATYEIWDGLHPNRAVEAVNRYLRNLYLPTFFPLSALLVGNNANDMEPSTVATDYTGSNATLATESTIVWNGAQSLKVTATAANGYARTASLNVNEGETYNADAACSVQAGDAAELRVINVDDSNASIENATTDEPAWMGLGFQFTIPTGCERIQAWMVQTGSNDVAYWDDLSIWGGNRLVYPLPSWITQP